MKLNNVSLDQVNGFANENINSHLGSHGMGVTGSYLQENRHAKVTERFQVIQPASIGSALAERNFELCSVITGKGRHDDKVDFQRTIARYRSKDLFEISGLSLDIIYISKHLGRGCDELRLGLYRGVCANQWSVGTLFDLIKFRHTGSPLDDISEGIQSVLSQRGKLVESIQRMQAKTLNVDEISQLCKTYADIRLQDKKNVIDVDFRKLARVRRNEDKALDLFTVANVLQENVIRFPLPYRLNSTDSRGNAVVRHQTTRQLRESSSQLVDLNGQLFDAAMTLVA